MLTLKLMGSFFVILSCACYSQLLNQQFQHQLDHLRLLYQVLYTIKGEITYTHAPLDEIFTHLEFHYTDLIQDWSRSVAAQIEEKTQHNFYTIWEQSITHYFAAYRLKAVHNKLLLEFGFQLDKADCDTKLGSLELILERFQEEIAHEESTLANKKRLCNYLGIMTGIFLVILLF